MQTPHNPTILIRDLPCDSSHREIETVKGGLAAHQAELKGGPAGAAGNDPPSLIIVVC